MTRFSLFVSILTIVIPMVLFFSTYKLSRLRDYNRIQKKRYIRLIYTFSIFVLLMNIGIWKLNKEEAKAIIQENKSLTEQKESMENEFNKLLSEGKSLKKDQKELIDENVNFSRSNKELSSKLEELKSLIIQKNNQIHDLESQVNIRGNFSFNMGNRGPIESKSYVPVSSSFNRAISDSSKLFNRTGLNKMYNITTDVSNKKN